MSQPVRFFVHDGFVSYVLSGMWSAGKEWKAVRRGDRITEANGATKSLFLSGHETSRLREGESGGRMEQKEGKEGRK